MEADPGDLIPALRKVVPCGIKHRVNVPGDEVEISVVHPRGTAGKHHGIGTCSTQHRIGELGSKEHDLFIALFRVEVFQRIAEKARGDAIPPKACVMAVVSVHVVGDERHTVRGAGDDIVSPDIVVLIGGRGTIYGQSLQVGHGVRADVKAEVFENGGEPGQNLAL